MKCISLHSPRLLNLSSSKFTYQHHKLKPAYCLLEQQHYNAKLATGFLRRKRTLLNAPLRALNSPAASGDLSVLLQTGAVMLFMYWIANFVVPAIVLKDLQDDSTPNNNKADEKDLL